MRQKVLARRFWSRMAAMHGGDDELRDRGEQEDAEGVEQRVPEEAVAEHRDEVLEADEVALALQQIPVVSETTKV